MYWDETWYAVTALSTASGVLSRGTSQGGVDQQAVASWCWAASSMPTDQILGESWLPNSWLRREE